MAKRLYVGNLSYHTTEGELLELFKQAGSVISCDLIIDRNTDRSKGFAFVEMGSDEEGRLAITQFNGKELGGRTLSVNEARPRAERPPGDFNGNHEAVGQGAGRWDDRKSRRH
jgi:cold-inducible RNA-binding protein